MHAHCIGIKMTVSLSHFNLCNYTEYSYASLCQESCSSVFLFWVLSHYKNKLWGILCQHVSPEIVTVLEVLPLSDTSLSIIPDSTLFFSLKGSQLIYTG